MIVFGVAYALILPAITMSKTAGKGSGNCDEFQITVQFYGMESNAFHNFIANSMSGTGYHLDIFRADSPDGDAVKTLYLKSAEGSEETGIFTWTVKDLETKDINGTPIEYLIKEKGYYQSAGIKTSVGASLMHRDGSGQSISVQQVSGENQAVLSENISFEQGDLLQIQNAYNGKQQIGIKLILDGWEDDEEVSNLKNMQLQLTPEEGYEGREATLNMDEATKDGNTFYWTIDDVAVEQPDSVKIPYVLKLSGYSSQDSEEVIAEAKIKGVHQDVRNIEGQVNNIRKTVRLSGMTFCSEESDKVEITLRKSKIDPGLCDGFKITAQFRGMDDQSFESFITNSVGRTGYYLEISRADTGSVVKELYFENKTKNLQENGCYTWSINDLKTRDANGRKIEYTIKEKQYRWNPSTETLVSAALKQSTGSMQVIPVDEKAEENQAILEPGITFGQGDELKIRNIYGKSQDTPLTKDVKIQLTLDILEDNPDVNDLKDMKWKLAPAESTDESKSRILNIEDSTKKGNIFTWTVKDVEVEQLDFTKIPYVITESGYTWSDEEQVNVTASTICTTQATQELEGTVNQEEKTISLPEMTFCTEEMDTVQITMTQNERPKICDSFQITAEFKGMDENAISSFVIASMGKNGYYLEISRADTGEVEKTLYLKDPDEIKKNKAFTWNINDLETKDKNGKPIEYIIKERDFRQSPDAETQVGAILKCSSTGKIWTIPVKIQDGQAVLDEKLTFEEGDEVKIRNIYDGSRDTPRMQDVNVKLTLNGWDTLDADRLEGMKLDLTPAEGYTGTKKTLDIEQAKKDGNTFSWTISDVAVEKQDFTKIPYVITESGYRWSTSAELTANASVICKTQEVQPRLEGNVNQEAKTITFSGITMCAEEKDAIQITVERSECETFTVKTRLQGLTSKQLEKIVQTSSEDKENGYYLAICQPDTGTIVKKLYLRDATPTTEAGTYIWEVSDLKTKDSSKSEIPYIVKEMNYQLKESPVVDIEAKLTDKESISVVQDAEHNQAVVDPAVSFKKNDMMEINHVYHVQYGSVKIQKMFDGLSDIDLENMINNSKQEARTGYYISIQDGTNLYLDQAVRDGNTFTWKLEDAKLAEEDGTPITYTVAEHQYLPENYSVNYKTMNILASVEGREDPDIQVTQDEQQETATLTPVAFSVSQEETLRITNQYHQMKRTGKIRIRTHLDGLRADEIEKLCNESKKENSRGFYIEIKQVKKESVERNLTSSEVFSERLYLSDAVSVSSDNTVFSWDVDDIPILDELNQPVSYQISQHNYPMDGYAETIVSADVTRTDATVSEIGTTPDTEHGVAGLDDVSFDSDLDTTVDTVDIRNSYTNDFDLICYDKNGKPVENATVTVKNAVTGEVIATGVTAAAGGGIAAGTVTIAGLALPGGTTAVLTVAGTTIVIGLTSAVLYKYYKNKSNVVTDDPEKKPDDPEMKYITLTLKKEWKRSENQAPKGAKVKFSVYKSENNSTDATKVMEVVLDGKADNLEVKPWEAKLKNLEGGIVQNKQVVKVYTYYVKEEPLDGYKTNYKGAEGEKTELKSIYAGGTIIQAAWACTGTDGEITAVNSEEYTLPKTGGNGKEIYTAGGVLIMVVSLLYGWLRRKKRERRT